MLKRFEIAELTGRAYGIFLEEENKGRKGGVVEMSNAYELERLIFNIVIDTVGFMFFITTAKKIDRGYFLLRVGLLICAIPWIVDVVLRICLWFWGDRK